MRTISFQDTEINYRASRNSKFDKGWDELSGDQRAKHHYSQPFSMMIRCKRLIQTNKRGIFHSFIPYFGKCKPFSRELFSQCYYHTRTTDYCINRLSSPRRRRHFHGFKPFQTKVVLYVVGLKQTSIYIGEFFIFDRDFFILWGGKDYYLSIHHKNQLSKSKIIILTF